MKSTDGTPIEPPSDSTAGQSVERLNQLLDIAHASVPPTEKPHSRQGIAAVGSAAREFFAEVSRTELRTLSKKELLLLIQALENFMQCLHILSLQVSEELFHGICVNGLNEKSLGLAVHMLTDTLQLSVAETGLLNKLSSTAAPTARDPTLRPPAP